MNFLNEAMAEKQYTVEWYRLLHRFPEPSRHEAKTNLRIREALNAMGVPYDAPSDNVTVARVEGLPGGKTVAIRAEFALLGGLEDYFYRAPERIARF